MQSISLALLTFIGVVSSQDKTIVDNVIKNIRMKYASNPFVLSNQYLETKFYQNEVNSVIHYHDIKVNISAIFGKAHSQSVFKDEIYFGVKPMERSLPFSAEVSASYLGIKTSDHQIFGQFGSVLDSYASAVYTLNGDQVSISVNTLQFSILGTPSVRFAHSDTPAILDEAVKSVRLKSIQKRLASAIEELFVEELDHYLNHDDSLRKYLVLSAMIDF
ncbi:hypothetical protein HDE_09520 [Halotydeus destructor]|nr:hypothetical protein HDE_09520 [Halotydeus destructor]